MGHWMNYYIKFANKEANMADALIEMGIAKKTEELDGYGEYGLMVDLKKINPVAFATGYKDDGIYNFVMSIRGNGLCYSSKWAPDDRLADSLGRCFPEDVLDIDRKFTKGYIMNAGWYSKNGKDTLKDGTPLTCGIPMLNAKLIRDKGEYYQVSLPIGEENDKWGKIMVPKNRIKYLEKEIDGQIVRYHHNLFFVEEKIDVFFKNKVVNMDVIDLVKAYFDSKDRFREDMTSNIEIHGLSPEDIVRKENKKGSVYYIVKIKCPKEVSSNGVLSITSPEWNVDLESGSICLGEKGKTKNALIMLEDGTMYTKEFRIPEIKEYYEQVVARYILPESQGEEFEEENNEEIAER